MKNFSAMCQPLMLAGLLTLGAGVAQAQSVIAPEWKRVERLGVASNSLTASATDAAGNTYIVGGFLGTARFGNFTLTSPGSEGSGYLLKQDVDGTILWARQIAGVREAFMTGVALDASGHVYVSGTMQYNATFDATHTLQGASVNSPDLFVAKYDREGNVQWANSYGGPAEQVDAMTGGGIATDASGNVYVGANLKGSATVGNTVFNSAGQVAPLLIKLTPDGDVTWARQATMRSAAPGYLGDKKALVSTDAAGNVWLSGMFTGNLAFGSAALSTSARAAAYLVKFSAGGDLVWARQSTAGDDTNVASISTDAVGNTYQTGRFKEVASFGPHTLAAPGEAENLDGFLVKYSVDGSPEWARRIGGSQTDMGAAVLAGSAGEVYLVGILTGAASFGSGRTVISNADHDVFLARYDASGSVGWIAQTRGEFVSGNGNTVGMDASGRLFLGYGNPMAFTARLDTRVDPKVLSVRSKQPVQVLQLYPNPATSAVEVANLPVGCTISVVDAVGRTVRSCTLTGASRRVSLQGLPHSLYTVRAFSPAGQQYSAQVLVQ